VSLPRFTGAIQPRPIPPAPGFGKQAVTAVTKRNGGLAVSGFYRFGHPAVGIRQYPFLTKKLKFILRIFTCIFRELKTPPAKPEAFDSVGT